MGCGGSTQSKWGDDRVGVMRKGEILLVQDKAQLMQQMGTKRLTIYLKQPISTLPDSLSSYNLILSDDGKELVYHYDTTATRTGITGLLSDISAAGLVLCDLQTAQSSLEDIFVDLVRT